MTIPNRRGLTDAECHLFEMLRVKLACVFAEIEFGLAERTVDHALPALKTLSDAYNGAVVLRAMMGGR